MLANTRHSAFAWATGLALMVTGMATAQGHPAFDVDREPAMGLTLQEGDLVYSSTLSLGASQEAMVSLRNPSRDAFVDLHVVALDSTAHRHREHMIRLEPQGVSLLGLSKPGLDQLFVLGDAPFAVDAEGLDDGGKRTLEVHRAVYQSAASRRSEAARNVTAEKVRTSPRGEWRLSCIAPADCTYVSPWHDGRVEDHDQIYWNLHTPISAFTTSNGSCSTIWYQFDSYGTPRRALNCYGQTYRISWRPYF